MFWDTQYIKIECCGEGAVKEQSFCMLLKLSQYKLKLECYNFRLLNVTAIGITNTLATEKEMRNEFKHFTTKHKKKKKTTKHKRRQQYKN